MHLVLIQTFEEPIHGYFDHGPKKEFEWKLDHFKDAGIPGKTCVGSWDANCYFHVKTGKTEKQTLGNARRYLVARAKTGGPSGRKCSFKYEKRS